ncbi:MAG: hypothetical protein JWL96_2896 [Sphingomonas bacterium]|nr:hypothetical protein [Sphingomonas bacterium]
MQGLRGSTVAARGRRLTPPGLSGRWRQSGRSSGVEHNLAKVGVEGSNPFARSSFQSTSLILAARGEADTPFSLKTETVLGRLGR